MLVLWLILCMYMGNLCFQLHHYGGKYVKRETKATPCSTTCCYDAIPDFCGATQLSSLSGAFFLLARIPSPPVKTQDTRGHCLAPSSHQYPRRIPAAHTTTYTIHTSCCPHRNLNTTIVHSVAHNATYISSNPQKHPV